MKKVLKVIVSIGAICAGVAAGLFVFSKMRNKDTEEIDEFDEYDDDFSDEEEVKEEAEV